VQGEYVITPYSRLTTENEQQLSYDSIAEEMNLSAKEVVAMRELTN